MKKKAFTLVELLSVVVILAIILIIAIPKIVETIENSRKGSFISSAKLVAESTEREYTVAQTLGKNLSEFESGIDCMNVTWAKLDTKDYSACLTKIVNGKAEVTLVGKDKFEEYSVCAGNKLDISIVSACNSLVTLDPNGGSVNPSAKEIGFGKKYENLPTPIREGFTFLGWYTDIVNGTQITDEVTKDKNAPETLYAHWSINTYTLSYDTNCDITNPTSISIIYGNTYGELPILNRTGYTFLGWYTDITDGTEVTESTTIGGSNTTIYAHWSINAYTLTYNANGGSVSPTSKSVTYNSTYGTLPDPTRSGYTFLGWFTAASGGTQVTANTTIGASNVTIYAHWQAIYVVSFTYTGTFTVEEGTNASSGNTFKTQSTNWRVAFTSSGKLTINNISSNIDIFAVGGGGGGGSGYYYHQGKSGYHRICGSGGGGGYTKTYKNIGLSQTSYDIVIGDGGAGGPSGGGNGTAGGTTSIVIGSTTYSANGAAGGSGGGGAGGNNGYTSKTNYGGAGGTNGGNGANGQFNADGTVGARSGGAGQGTTTRAFGESSGALYSTGGAGGSTNGTGATGNATAGNGGGGAYSSTGASGTKGVLVIRNKR